MARKRKSVWKRWGFTSPNPGLLIIGLGVMAGVGPVLIVKGNALEDTADQSSHWSETKGRIVVSQVVAPPKEVDTGRWESAQSSKDYTPRVVYTYKVQDVEYKSARINFGFFQGRPQSEEIVRRFPAGTEVPVYYDPAHPDQAVLIKGMAGRNKLSLMGDLAVIIGLVMTIGAFRQND